MNAIDTHYKKMTETPVSKLIITLGIPTTVSMLISSIYNLADTYFVGSLGESAQGAIGVLFTLQCIIQAIAFMFGHGSGVFVAKYLAEKDQKTSSVYVSSAFYVGMILGLFISVFGLIFLTPLMKVLGSSQTILPYAKEYGVCVLITAPFMIGSLVLNNCLRYESKAFYAMIGLGTGGLLNILGDFLLVSVFNCGVLGAGIATAVSQFISFVLLIVLYSRYSQSKVNHTLISNSVAVYLNIIKVGLPSLIRQGLTAISGGILNNLAKLYGDAANAAMGIVNKYLGLIMYVGLGIGQGFQPVSSFNYEAKKFLRVKKSVSFTLLFGTIIVCVLSIPGIIFPEAIISFFQESSEVIKIGTLALRVASIGVIFMPISVVSNMLFQSTRQALTASFLAMLRSGLAFIPTILILHSYCGVTAVQISQPIADVVSSLVSLPFLIVFISKLPNKDFKENSMEQIVVASGNKGKIKEIKAIFGDKYIVVPMSELGFNKDIEETGTTFLENALIKAKTVSLALNKNVLADDSGLMVTALNGAPGIYSARYSGGGDKENRALLLKNIENANDRSAKFVSAVVLYKTDGSYVWGIGETHGVITTEERGENGFGYDCIFLSNDLQVTFGEASDEDKNKVSHRYRALCDLYGKLNENE
ncbi:MAG: RdgB/HAM1 family non-canonical purine NTP pyrophosphatase [Clostridia bacterium]|nr:RdgB/HAM1 family non-canonical purine NTP pyrophosphatase [Clostridia bacterium]